MKPQVLTTMTSASSRSRGVLGAAVGELRDVALAVDGVLVAAERDDGDLHRSWWLAGTTPNITYEKEHAGTFEMDSRRKFFAANRVARNSDGEFALEGAREGNWILYVLQQEMDDLSVTTEITIRSMPAMSSRRWLRHETAYPMLSPLFQDEIATSSLKQTGTGTVRGGNSPRFSTTS